MQVVLLVEPLKLDLFHIDLLHFLENWLVELDPDIRRVSPFLYFYWVTDAISSRIELLQNYPIVDISSCLFYDWIFNCAFAWLQLGQGSPAVNSWLGSRLGLWEGSNYEQGLLRLGLIDRR